MAKDSLSRLRWRCRRGLLELDLLLGAFLDTGYEALTREEKQAFETLLRYPDLELWRCCFAEEPQTDPVIANVISKIRRTALP